MAVITGPKHSSLFDRLGTGLGAGYQKGVSEQLKALAEQRIKGLQAEKFSQLFGGGQAAQTGAPAEGGPPGEAPSQTPGGATMPSLSDVLKAPFLSTQEKMNLAGHIQRGDLAERKMAQQRELATQKIEARSTERKAKSVDERLSLNSKAAQEAEAIIPSLDEYDRILETGDVGSPGMNRVRLWFGKQVFGDDVDMDWVLKQDDQTLRKLSVDFLRKDIKGLPRPSQVLINQLVKGNPNIFTDKVVQKFVIGLKKYTAYDAKAYDRVQRNIAIENPGMSLRQIDKRTERDIEPIRKSLQDQFLPKISKYKVGQSIDKLPSPLEAPIGAQFAKGKYIIENTGLKWKKVGVNPNWKGE